MTTTATEHPTLSNSEALALPVGTRVEFLRYGEWKAGTVASQDALQSHERHSEYVLVRPDEEFGWQDGGIRYWFATEGVRRAEPFTFGDRVQFTRGTRTYSGTVVGRYAPTSGDRSWLVADDSLPADSDPYAYRRTLGGTDDGPAFTFHPSWPDPRPLSAWIGESDLTRVTDAPEATAPDSNGEAERILRMIGEAMAETSDRHEWCGEYERILDRLVDSLPYGHLRDVFSDAAHRDRDFTVYVEVNVSTRVPVSVSASSSGAAEEMVRDDPWAYLDTYTLRDSLAADDVEFGDVECED